ncbi:unnamed protein product, partial [Iphiclides podalirius]
MEKRSKRTGGTPDGGATNNRSLKSGNSLIDWIRLGNSGVDLTGVSGRPRLVSPAELKKHNTKSSEYVRSYTPLTWDCDPRMDHATQLQLAVKRYDNGILSPVLSSLSTGDVLKVSGPYGNFQLHKLKTIKTIYLLAAGTGITPMLGLIKFLLAKSNPACESIYLLFFNKTEKDIMFQELLESLANTDNRFYVVHILSNASSVWTGRKGRINATLLSEIMDEGDMFGNEDSRFAVICGPKEFTFASLNVLRCLGMEECFIHVFVG